LSAGFVTQALPPGATRVHEGGIRENPANMVKDAKNDDIDANLRRRRKIM
jgi:hypothetical protein